MRSYEISLAALFSISVELDPIIGIEFIQCSGLIFHQAEEEISKRAATVAARQTKRRSENFPRETQKVYDNVSTISSESHSEDITGNWRDENYGHNILHRTETNRSGRSAKRQQISLIIF
jgi:hypothetical protein